MRRSPLRHPLAVLRIGLGMGQRQLAGLLGCSVATVQAIELQRLSLSGRLAQVASDQTGISAGWLLRGDPEADPITAGGQSFTKETFAAHQAGLLAPGGQPRALLHLARLIGEWVNWKARAFECLRLGLEQGRPGLVVFRLNQALSAVLQDLENQSRSRRRSQAPLRRVFDEVRKAQEKGLAATGAAGRGAEGALDLAKGLYARANEQVETYVAETIRRLAQELEAKRRTPGKRAQASVRDLRAGEGSAKRRRVRR